MSVKPTTHTSQSRLRAMGESLKSYLESYGVDLFSKGSHYLVELKSGKEAQQAWARQMREPTSNVSLDSARVIERMMGGGLKKNQKKLYPWTTFCFRPANILQADGTQTSFLNLQALNNVSNTLWALVRVHSDGERQPLELCCYVGRDIPGPDEPITPQVRIPLQQNFKLTSDGGSGTGALFSDNAFLSNSLQVTPSVVDLFEVSDGDELSFTLHNVCDEDLTITNLVGRDFDEDDQPLQGLTLSGLERGAVIAAGESLTFSVRRDSEAFEDLVKLSIGYMYGEPDEEAEEGEFDEEAFISLQGEDEHQLHTFLFQGELYELLKRALQAPSDVLSEVSAQVDLNELIKGGDELDLEEREEGDVTLILNEGDLSGGSLGTIPLKLTTARLPEVFASQAQHDPEDEPLFVLQTKTLTFEGACALPESMINVPSKSRKRPSKASASSDSAEERHEVTLEPIYLGSLTFYNGLKSPDQDKLRNVLLNCVAVAALARALEVSSDDEQGEALEVEADLSL